MKHLFIFIFILFFVKVGYSQCTPATPSGYTSFLGLRLYDQDVDPCVDSLNQNSRDIDAGVKANNDTINAVKTDVYSVITYSGALKNAVVSSANLATSLDTNLVKTTGIDNIWGTKTFKSGVYLSGLLPPSTNQYFNGNSSVRWFDVYSKYVHTDYLVMTNPSSPTDTAMFTYNGTKISSSKDMTMPNLDISGSINYDSAAVLKNITYGVYDYAIANVSDSVIQLQQDTIAVLKLSLPGTVSNINKIMFSPSVTGRGEGVVIKIINTTAVLTVTFIDAAADGNLQLGANITLGQYDYLELMYIYDGTNWYWIKIGYEDN